MELSSDSDDCQLYTRAAENVSERRKHLLVKVQESEQVIDLNPKGKENLKGSCERNATNSHGISDEVLKTNLSDSEDDVPLSELRMNLRSRSIQKNCVQANRPTSKNNKGSSGRKRKRKGTRPTRDLGVIVLDDDTGYPTSLPPIDFNSRSKKKNKISECSGINTSIMSKDSDEDDYYENEVVTVIVEWHSHSDQKITSKEFKLLRHQKLETIFEEFAKMEKVPTTHVLLMLNFSSVKPTDTPASLNLKFYGALTGSVSGSNRPINYDKPILETSELKGNKNDITVKLQLETKQMLILTVNKREKLNILYSKSSEELKCEQHRIKITFDGECVEPNENFIDIEAENGDIFHVHLKK